jgi:membrane associated rhomboid family serine protease
MRRYEGEEIIAVNNSAPFIAGRWVKALTALYVIAFVIPFLLKNPASYYNLAGQVNSRLFAGLCLWQPVTAAFVSTTIMDLLSALMLLWFCGRMLENEWRNRRRAFPVFCLTAAVVCGLAAYVIAPFLSVPVFLSQGLGFAFIGALMQVCRGTRWMCFAWSIKAEYMLLITLIVWLIPAFNPFIPMYVIPAFAGFIYGLLWPYLSGFLAGKRRQGGAMSRKDFSKIEFK